MTLDAWIKAAGLTSAAFADLVGVAGRTTVHKWRIGESFPSPDHLARIREATGGAVTADDFLAERAAS